jgi:hypothetical protein
MKPAGRVRGFGGMAVHRGTVRAESGPRFHKGTVRWVILRRVAGAILGAEWMRSSMKKGGAPRPWHSPALRTQGGLRTVVARLWSMSRRRRGEQPAIAAH